MAHLLEVNDLQTHFFIEGQALPAVDGVSFHLDKGETLGLVGESGCGKSMTAFSVMRLVPSPGKIVGGKVLFDGENLLKMPIEAMRGIRGRKIGMVFQEPLSSLNPVQTIGQQIGEVLTIHQLAEKKAIKPKVIDALAKVGFPDPVRHFDCYPHEISGGMRQRAMIAMALIGGPQILIADEPTTALDVTIQAQILELLRALQNEYGLAVLLITHNLGIVAEVAQRVAVMYAGRIVETARVDKLFAEPHHPYTQGLLASVPSIHREQGRLYAIPGMVPELSKLPNGCRFHPRCERATDRCRIQNPVLRQIGDEHAVACWLYEGEKV
jgi:oligopeptide/dipeptide ABC transporter ATP-binding protein